MGKRFLTALILVIAFEATAGEAEPLVIVRHAATLEGRVEGTIHQLLGESVSVKAGAVITGDIHLPGKPKIVIKTPSTYDGTLSGAGATTPTSYNATLFAGGSLRHFIQQTDPVSLENIAAPPAATGTRTVTITAPGQSIGDSTTLKDLILNTNTGITAVPSGTYNKFTVNAGATLQFGTAGTTTPVVYNLQQVDINGGSIAVVGPIMLNVNGFTMAAGSVVGKQDKPEWLLLRQSGTYLPIHGSFYGTIKNSAAMLDIFEDGTFEGLIRTHDLKVHAGAIVRQSPFMFNQGPQVNAGAAQTVTFPTAIVLSGSASDDGLPNPPGALTYAWSKVSGPGNATFANAAALSTTVKFSESGTYVLRLTASDSVLSASSDVTIVSNQAPTVEAGATVYINFPSSASLNGTVTDDGLPAGGVLTSSWSKVSGPGNVTFANASAPVTTATFSAGGIYVVRLSASDSLATSTDDVSIVVNNPPVVSAGADQTITLPDSAILSGTVTDDGVLNNVLIIGWTKLSGPGTVTFGDATKASTTASFSQGGVYVLQLSANDSLATTVDTVTIIVNTGPIANAGPDLLITLPEQALLEGVASDDGVPAGVEVTSTWSKVSGPGDVTFDDASAPVTQASFSAGGTYVLRLSVTDSLATSVDETTVIVNLRPVVSAGQNQTVNFPTAVTLQGSTTDDGLPNPPATLTYAWTKVSGPGAATFANAEAASTTVSFNDPGTYVLRLTANDSVADASADVTIVSNATPVVDAGPDVLISLPTNTTTLFGAVTDDGLPNPPGALTIAWSKVSGPGDVTFDDSTVAVTQASFSVGGTYVLRLTATDSHATAFDETTVVVNSPPVVNAGANQAVNFPANVTLQGSATDDGLPNPPAMLTYAWTKVSGPGTATFANAEAASTTVSFSDPGTYVLRLTASDSVADANADVTIVSNATPVVDAGPDVLISLPTNTTTLFGAATDDGLPNPPGALTIAWSKVSGPGDVTFSTPNSLSTDATFTTSGVYVLRLTADDSLAISTDEITVTVNAPPVVSAGDDQTIRLPADATLTGTATDDGLPTPPGVLTYSWIQVSGPGTVTFENESSLTTRAVFSVEGSYVLRLTVSDSATETNDEITITVLAANLPPLVSIDGAETIRLPNGIILTAIASDDGLPNPPASLSYAWSKMSGPGTVTFSYANQYATGVEFSEPGAYVVRVIVSDSEYSAFADATITVLGMNQPPEIFLGTDKIVALPQTMLIDGVVIDDGNPLGGALTATWNKQSGPGTVTFSDLNSPFTVVAFSEEGTYVLRLTASDSELTVFSDLTVSVLPAVNQPPVVSITANSDVSLSEALNLIGSVADDGLPLPSNLSGLWQQISGPGSVTFADATQFSTTATFSSIGIYELQLSAIDTELTSSAQITVFVGPANKAPIVNAGPDQTVQASALLRGQISDDGLPNGILTSEWTKVSGPGNVSFANATAAGTSAEFSQSGLYVLRLTVSDGDLTANDELSVTVVPGNLPPLVSAGPDKQLVIQPSPSTGFTLNVIGSVTSPVGRGIDTMHTGQLIIGGDPNSLTHPTVLSIIEADGTQKPFTIETDLGAIEEKVAVVPDTGKGTNIGGFTLGEVFCLSEGNSSTTIGITRVSIDGNTVQKPWVYVPILPRGEATFLFFDKTGVFGGDLIVVGSSIVRVNSAGVVTNAGTLPTRAAHSGTVIPNDPRYGPWAGKILVETGLGTFHTFDVQKNRVDYPNFGINDVEDIEVIPASANFYGLLGANTLVGVPASAFNGMAGDILVVQEVGSNGGVWRVRWNGTDFDKTRLNGPSNFWECVTFSKSGVGPIPTVQTVTLIGNVSDDGTPSGAALTCQWIKLSGPGDVEISSPNATTTTVAISVPGTYVFRLTASDTEFTVIDEVTVSVLENQRPTVNAGNNQTVSSKTVNLNGTASDDGLPVNTLKTTWSRTSGPGSVFFANVNSPTTQATFSVPGTYVLRLTADDSQMLDYDEVTITINANKPPTCGLGGTASTVVLPNMFSTTAPVQDDGLPVGGTVSALWSVVSGPGPVFFGNPNTSPTSASFVVPGTYVLRINMSDSELTSFVDKTVNVLPHTNTAPSVSTSGNFTVVRGATFTVRGIATDDGLPLPSNLSVQWSGPSSVIFGNPNSLTTTGVCTGNNVQISLTVSDGELSTTTSISITVVANTVQSGNATPLVHAGFDYTALKTDVVQLFGNVSDDGLPAGNNLNINWTVSPSTGVTIANAHSPNTTVSYAANASNGNYVFTLTASDGVLTGSDSVSIFILSSNTIPTANAGSDQTIIFGSGTTLYGTAANSDNLPFMGVLTTTWSKFSYSGSGPGNVSFGSPNNKATTASFDSIGTYVLRFTSNDGAASVFDDVTVNVVPANNLPIVNAGADQTVKLPTSISLNGSVTDDNVPNGAVLKYLWNKVSGPGNIHFSAPNSLTTTASFTEGGTYVISLLASDSQFIGSDQLIVTVIPENEPPLVNAGPDSATQLSQMITLNGTVSDDLLQTALLGIFWTQIGGPDIAEIGSAFTPSTVIRFHKAGIYTFRLTVNDAINVVSDDVVVTVIAPINQPPVVNAGPDLTVTIPNSAILNGTWSDDGEPRGVLSAKWSKVNGHAGVQFVTVGGQAQATFALPGDYVLRLTVSDSVLTTSDDIIVHVLPVNEAPTVSAGPDLNIPINGSASLNGIVTDDALPVGSTLTTTWSVVTAPGNVVFSNAAAASTTATFSATGIYVLRLSASDSEFTVSDEVAVVVTDPAPNRAPIVNAGQDSTLFLPQLSTVLSGSYMDDGLPANAPTTVSWSKVGGAGTVTFASPSSLNTNVSFSTVGVYLLRLTVSDSEFTSTDDVRVNVYEPVTGPGPSVTITAPSDGAELTKPTTVTANVSGGNWVAEYALNTDENNPANLTFVQFGSGTGAVANASVGVLDTTLMLNGSYVVRVTSTDTSGQSASASISVVVERNMKVGHFSLAFNDLTVPVQGVPISIVRTYDSRDKRVGDFGVGWQLALRDIRLQKTGNLGRSWNESYDGTSFLPRYAVFENKPHKVTITFPDGKVYKFQGGLTPSSQLAGPITTGTYSFTPIAPTLGSLQAVGSSSINLSGPNGVGFSAPDGLTPVVSVEARNYNGTIFNPTTFVFTSQEGIKYVIDQKDGLKSITDLNGNTVTITPNGFISSTGKSVVFVRDAKGRITRIEDPSGGVMNYEYDAAGDLVKFKDRESNATQFTFDNRHNLLTIVDPRGITPIRNDYDASGRLLKHTDAFGKEIVYTHNIAGRSEQIADRLNNITTYTYDDRGNVTSVTDAEGGITTMTYDTRDNELVTTKFGAGGVILSQITNTYDALDNKLTETDALGNKTTYTYNSRRQMLTVKDAEGNITTNTYDAKGNLTTTKDALNNVTTYGYNVNVANGSQPATMTNALLDTWSFAYDQSGNKTFDRDANNHDSTMAYNASNNLLSQTTTRTIAGNVVETLVTTYQYDSQQRPTKTVFADDTFTEVTYNSIGKQATTKDQLGRITTYEYDELGRLKKTTYPDTLFEESTYDEEGRRLTSKDRAGRITTYEYDKTGRLTKTIFPDLTFTQTVYDLAGQVIETIDQRNNSTKYKYDTAGRRTEIEDALGKKTFFTYDKNGNQLTMTDANNHVTTYVYDDNNRRIMTIFHDGTFTETEYDELGQRIAEIDQDSKRTEFTYDKLGRLTSVKDALEQTTAYTYNEVGQQITQVDARQKLTHYEYDKLGRRTKRTLPLGMAEIYGYDNAGNLTSRKDFNNWTTTYEYDNLNRLKRKIPDAHFLGLGAQIVTYGYTATGQRETMVDDSGTTTYTYDSNERLLTKATPNGTLVYTYDNAGNIKTLRSSTSGGASMDYTYDALNRLKTAKDNRHNQTTTYGYDDVGNLASYSYANGIATSYTYNALNRLTNVSSAKTGSKIASFGYTLGNAGNRLSVSELSGRTATYTYDAIYRLTGETIAGSVNPAANGVIGYTHDAVGNRLTRTSTVAAVPAQTSTYDANDRLTSDAYDSMGNTITSEGKTYSYDFENRVKMVSGGGPSVSVVYDGDGNRVTKTVNGVTTKFLVDTNNLTGYAQVVEEQHSTGAVQRVYAYGLDLISQDQPIAGTWTQHFYGYDGHGSVRYLTDSSGAVTDTYDFDAFGILTSQTGSTPNLYLYCGEQFDPDLGFYYLRARYMTPSTGRFMSMDSWEGRHRVPCSLHKYAYGYGNPVNRIDPSGHMPLVVQNLVAALQGLLQNIAHVNALATYYYFQGMTAAATFAYNTLYITALMAVYGMAVTEFGYPEVGALYTAPFFISLAILQLAPPDLEASKTNAGMRMIDITRRSLNIGKDKNIATFEVVTDEFSGNFASVSSKYSPPGTSPVPLPGSRVFETKVVDFDRAYDSEVKGFEQLSKILSPTAKGTVSVFSERPWCDSCTGVLAQFRRMFPGITITTGNGPKPNGN